MPLSGSIPKDEEQRLKAYLYGPPGGGKTLAALHFPNAYIIDTAKETTRYGKLVREKNSHVFHCRDPYRVMKELEILRDEPHPFQTLVIDEGTTLYKNLQAMWIGKFVTAQQERSDRHKRSGGDNLLEDFGYRYWDKVKRDWGRLIDLIRQLDMNIIMNAHQKNKYGMGQTIIGITSATDASDEHVWDFVFHIIKRGEEYKAITEKQRILPIEIDPNAKRFPDEFAWNYDNLIKFYEKEYIEKPTKNSKLPSNGKTNLSGTNETGTNNIPPRPMKEKATTKPSTNKKSPPPQPPAQKIPPPQQPKEEKPSTSDRIINTNKIISLLLKECISDELFRSFLKDLCKWTNYTPESLTDKQQALVLDNWENKILPKLKEIKQENANKKAKANQSKPNAQTVPNTQQPTELPKKTLEERHNNPNYSPANAIREDQVNEIKLKLQSRNISVERFFSGFSIKEWKEITQEGADNMLDKFATMIGAIK